MIIELLKSQNIELSKLETNKGQIEGLPKNPRHIKSEKYEKLKKSIEDNPEMLGMREVLVYPHGSKYVIIGGNMRFQACKELGFITVPCKVLDKDMTAEQLRAITIKDNVGFGEHDWELLANEWDSVELEEWGLEVQNFETEETILEAEEDDYEEPENLNVDVVLGDLIEFECTDGRVHRLLCGDSTDSDTVAKLMNGEKADMVFTDPPYGVDYKGINNDDRDGLEDLLNSAFENYLLNVKNGASIYCFHSDRCADIFHKVFREFCHFSSMIIWEKESIVLSQTDYQSKHESCLYGWFDNGTHKWYSDRKQESIWIAKSKREEGHTTPKPIEIVSKALNNSSLESHLIFDLFLGSGSTMVASHQLKRKCYGMELNPKYCQVIIDRMTKLDNTLKIKINGKDYANT